MGVLDKTQNLSQEMKKKDETRISNLEQFNTDIKDGVKEVTDRI